MNEMVLLGKTTFATEDIAIPCRRTPPELLKVKEPPEAISPVISREPMPENVAFVDEFEHKESKIVGVVIRMLPENI